MSKTPIVSILYDKNGKRKIQTTGTTYPNSPAGNMGRFIDSALGAKSAKQNESESLVANRANEIDNDPAWQILRNMAMSQWNNPGISQALLDKLKGQISAQSAAQASGSVRGIMQQLAQRNISGTAAANYAALLNNQASINRNKNLLDVDLNNAQVAQQGKNVAFDNLKSVTSTQHSMQNQVAQLLAALKSQYNPVNDMRSAQAATQPLQELAALIAQRRRS